MVDRSGNITSERSFFKTFQLCFVSSQPRLILPVSCSRCVVGDAVRSSPAPYCERIA